MKLPQPENWTIRTSERVIARLTKIFEQYEKFAEFDESGNQINKKAEELYSEGCQLQDQLPLTDKKRLNYTNLFQ